MSMCKIDYTSNKTDYICLSTETKDTENVCNGTTCLEVDTAKVFIFYKGTWYEL